MKSSSVRRRAVTLGTLVPILAATLPAQGRAIPDRATSDRVAIATTTRATPAVSQMAASAADQLLARPVTVMLDGVTLRQAVAALADEAGVRIQFRASVIDAVTRPVTLHARNVSLGRALEQVLFGTRLRAVPVTDDIITIKDVSDADAQDGAIVGKVVHAQTKQPIASATVLLDDALKGVLTDKDGTFHLPASAGKHSLTVRAVGFLKQSQSITVAAGANVSIEVSLAPSTSVLQEVVVTGTAVATERKAIPNPITVITADDIEARGITRIDQLFRGEVPGMLALDVGVMRYGNGAAGNMAMSNVYSRGQSSLDGTPTPLKTYVDGVELPDASYLGTIDPKSIERIEIITGPQAATIYGSGALGGVMQVFTKRGSGSSKPDFTLGLKYGMLESNLTKGNTPSHDHSLSMKGGTGPELSYAATASYRYTGQWQPQLFARTYGASAGATHTRGGLTLNASMSLTSGENGTSGSGSTYVYSGLSGDVATYHSSLIERLLREDGTTLPSNRTAGYLSQQLSTSSSQTFGMTIDYLVRTGWQHHLTIGRSQSAFALVPQAPGFTYNADTLYRTRKTDAHRINLSYNTTLLGHVADVLSSQLTIGADRSFGEGSSLNACLTAKEASAYVPCSQGGQVTASQSVQADNWGGFGSWQIGFWDQLFLTMGARAERNPNYGKEHRIDWTPRVGATYTMEYGDLTLKVLGSYGRATRPPTPTQRMEIISPISGYDQSRYVSQQAAPMLGPEYAHGPQGGIELYYGNVGTFSINHYSQTVDNLIQGILVDTLYSCQLANSTLCYTFNTFRYTNVATIKQQGWEATGSLALFGLSAKGTYSWNAAKVTHSYSGLSYNAYYRPDFGMNEVPTHTANVVVGYAHGGTSVSLSTNYVGSSYIYAGYFDIKTTIRSLSRHKMYLDSRETIGWFKRGDYAKSDLAVTQRLTSSFSATLNVTNLGNSFSSDVSEIYPTLGRQTLLGVSMRFPRR